MNISYDKDTNSSVLHITLFFEEPLKLSEDIDFGRSMISYILSSSSPHGAVAHIISFVILFHFTSTMRLSTGLPILLRSMVATIAAGSAKVGATDYPFEISNCHLTTSIEKSPERVMVASSGALEIMLAMGIEEKVSAYRNYTLVI